MSWGKGYNFHDISRYMKLRGSFNFSYEKWLCHNVIISGHNIELSLFHPRVAATHFRSVRRRAVVVNLSPPVDC